MKDFKDKVVVISGGATGIGKALADKFGAEGAKVIICARRENRLQEAVKDLKDRGVDAHYKVCDVTKLEDLTAVADYAWDTFGQVDVLVNNAGAGGGVGKIVNSSKESFLKVFDINVFGSLNGVWAFGRRMIEQGTPAMILNINSETGLYPVGPYMGTYTASKYVGRAVSEILRLEMPEHIHVACVYPGSVQSELGGSTALTELGMPTEEFIDIIWPQIENGEFHIVSHPYARDYFNENSEEIINAFDRYAPHYDGDHIYDSKWIAKQQTSK